MRNYLSLWMLLFLLLLVSNNGSFAVENNSFANSATNKINNFAFDLYKQIDLPEQNIILSPYSLSSLVGKLAVGAHGDTRDQLLHLFHASSYDDMMNINAEFRKIDSDLKISNVCNGWLSCLFNQLWQHLPLKLREPSFFIANAMWANKDFVYKPSFIKMIDQNKSVNFFRLDFKQNPEVARYTINDWVAENTKNHIKDLMPAGSITPMTRLVLTNAIYFKGNWALPFDEKMTESKPFTLQNGNPIETPMMHQEDKFFYVENELLQMVQLDYDQTSLAMAIIFPKINHTVKDVLQTLNADLFLQLTRSVSKRKINITMPKFKIESHFDSLIKALQALGVEDAFNEKANFINMTESQIIISDIIQKAMLQVDERGTIAAAGTAVGMVAVAYEPPIEFNLNRPFLFFIFDKRSHVLLFMGQIMNPELPT